jgi:hypothetical protein
MASTLLILDIKDLWDNAYKQFGSKCRLDFSKIIRKAKVNNNKIVSFAFIQTIPGKKQDSLLRKLESANITPIVYDDKIDMREVFDKNIDSCSIFMLGSGSLELINFVQEANYKNKETYILACAEGLDTVLANEADDIILLTKSETINL